MAERSVDFATSCVLLAIAIKRRRRRRRNRTIWTKKWIQNRELQGAFHQLLKELQQIDTSGYRNFVRMDATTFEELLSMVAPRITYKDTVMRQAISPGERLAVTLRFLATGETFESLKFLYRVPSQTIGRIIPETCQALIDALSDNYLKVPTTKEEWMKISHDFTNKWNFNNCIGSMDGKHIVIKPPPNSGSYYFNYKHTFSIVLLAIVDANYKFLYVDIGCNGRISDGGVFRNCSIYQMFERKELNVPDPTPLPGTTFMCPYSLVADDAFPLKMYILKPYSQIGLTKERRIFNYRLSRARRVVENAFGILSNRFRVFMSPINLIPDKVETITMACCALHNFLRSRTEANAIYMPPGSVDREDPETHIIQPGEWQQGPQSTGFVQLARQGSNTYSKTAKDLRDQICKYFNSKEGEVPWQWNMI